MYGFGLIRGLIVTGKNFVQSFYNPSRYTTQEYPEVKSTPPEAYRSFPFLVTDSETDPLGALRCVACLTCEKECPAQCIFIEKSKDKKPDANGRLQFYPTQFIIDSSVCMSCQICVEVCPFDSIKMDKVFEVAVSSRFENLLLTRDKLTKSNQYFHLISPSEAQEVDDRLAAERKVAQEKAAAQAKAKAEAAALAAQVKPVPTP